jgi:O-acetyl-ADP-ribose deacetylase (regulator of RNase III)
MELNIINADLFTNSSEAIILNIDGETKGEGKGGKMARKFQGLYPELWNKADELIPIPLAYGDIFVYRPQDHVQYKAVIISSFLNHTKDLSQKEREDVAYTAVKNALQYCVKHNIKSLATPLMTGGWRIPTINAFVAMSHALEKISNDADLNLMIYILDEKEYKIVSDYAKSTGWLD